MFNSSLWGCFPGHMTLETSSLPPHHPPHHLHPHPTLLSSNPGLYSPKLILEIEKLKHCSFTLQFGTRMLFRDAHD